MNLKRIYERREKDKCAVWLDEDVPPGHPHRYVFAYEDGHGGVNVVRARFAHAYGDGTVDAIAHDQATCQNHPDTTIEVAIDEIHGYFALDLL